MPRVLQRLALLASFITLQFTLVSGGAGCLMPSGSAVSSGAMQSMVMAGMDMADPATTRSDDATPASSEAPCDESAATVACPSMAPCASAALPLLMQVVSTGSDMDPSSPAALRTLAPPSVSAAPEIPPPRA